MICFLACQRHFYTAGDFFRSWGGEAWRGQPRCIAYEKINLGHRIPGGLFLFTDFERLLPE